MEIPLKFKIDLDKQPLKELNDTLDISLKKFNEISKTFQQQVETLKQLKNNLQELQESTQNINKDIVAKEISENIAENINNTIEEQIGDINLPVKIDSDVKNEIEKQIGDINLPVKIDSDVKNEIEEQIGDINLPVKIDTDIDNKYRILNALQQFSQRYIQPPKEIPYINAEEADIGAETGTESDISQQKKDLSDALAKLQQLKKNLGKDTTKIKKMGFSSGSKSFYKKEIPIIDEIIEPFKSVFDIIKNVAERFLDAGETVYNAFKSFKDSIRENIIDPYRNALEQFSNIASQQLGLLYDNVSQKYLKETTQEEAKALGMATTTRDGKLYRELTDEERKEYGVVSKKGGGERISPGKMAEIKILAKTTGKGIRSMLEDYKGKIIGLLITVGTLLLFTFWNMFIVGKLLPWLKNSEMGKTLFSYLKGIYNVTKSIGNVVQEIIAWLKQEPTPQEKQQEELINLGFEPEQASAIAFPEYREHVSEGYRFNTDFYNGKHLDYEKIQQTLQHNLIPTEKLGTVLITNQDLDKYMRRNFNYRTEKGMSDYDNLIKNQKDIATIEPKQYEYMLKSNDEMLNVLNSINKNIMDLNKNIQNYTPNSSIQANPLDVDTSNNFPFKFPIPSLK